MATLAFIRITSASMPSSLKNPLLTANPDGRKLMLKLVTEMRILSAAMQISGTTPANPISNGIDKYKFFIRERDLSLLIFSCGFENRLRDGPVGAAAADVAVEPFGNLLDRKSTRLNSSHLVIS